MVEVTRLKRDVAKRLSRIENFFSMLLANKGISDNIFVGELPPTTQEGWKSMVLVDVNRQTDYDAYSTGSASIYLYARPTGEYPSKNVKLLNTMEKCLDAALDGNASPNYTVQVNWRDSDYDNARNFHFNVVNVNVVVW